MAGLNRLATALSLAMGIAGSVLPAFGQAGGQGTAPPPSTPAPSTPSPGTGTTTPSTGGRGRPGTIGDPNQQQNPFEIQRPMFLSGKVVLDDGTPPPMQVTIERVCNGNPRAEAHTDSKGRFSFQLGQNTLIQDASTSSNSDPFGSFGGGSNANRIGMGPGGMNQGVSERDLMGCEIRAALAGYRSDAIPLSGRRMFDNPDLGTIVLHRLGNVEGVTISAVSLQAPKDAKKAWEKGQDHLKKKKIPEAQKEFEKAVAVYPKYSQAWFDLGRTLEAQNNNEGALRAYGEALAVDPKFVFPYRHMTGIFIREQKWQEAADASSKLVKLNPFEFPDGFYYNSVANYFLRNYDEAEKSIREAQKLDTRNRMVKSSHLLGSILIEKQDYTGAAEQLRKYLSVLPAGQTDENAVNQLSELEKIVGAKPPGQN